MARANGMPTRSAALKPDWVKFENRYMPKKERDAIVAQRKREQLEAEHDSLPPSTGNPETDLILAWQRDPLLWFETMFPDYSLRPWQKIAIREINKSKYSAIKTGNRCGKTMMMAIIALYGVTTRIPIKVCALSTTSGQMGDAFWSELRLWFYRLPVPMQERYVLNSEKLYLNEPSQEIFITQKSAALDKLESLQGLHSDNFWLLCDESSGIEDRVFEYLDGNIASLGGKMLLCGNPIKSTGRFYRAFNELSDNYYTQTVNTLTIEGIDHRYLEQMRAEHGETSNVWRYKILGEFPIDEDDVLIPQYLIQESWTTDEPDKNNRYPVYWGLDPAGQGNDAAALAKRQGFQLLDKIKLLQGKTDSTDIINWIEQEYKRTLPHLYPDRIFVDSNGLGAATYDRLRDLGYPVVAVNTSRSPDNKNRFRTMRSELWWRMREWFRSARVTQPKDLDLLKELIGVKYAITTTGQIDIEGKPETKKRIGRSPDRADSLMITFKHDSQLIRDGIKRRGINSNRDKSFDNNVAVLT